MSTNITANMTPVEKPDPIAPDQDELNINQPITDQPNINHPAVDEPKIGDNDITHDDVIEDMPHRQMQAENSDAHQAADSLHRETRKEERKVERLTGEDLPKGEERFEERSKSSDGMSAGAKQA